MLIGCWPMRNATIRLVKSKNINQIKKQTKHQANQTNMICWYDARRYFNNYLNIFFSLERRHVISVFGKQTLKYANEFVCMRIEIDYYYYFQVVYICAFHCDVHVEKVHFMPWRIRAKETVGSLLYNMNKFEYSNAWKLYYADPYFFQKKNLPSWKCIIKNCSNQ